MAYQLAPIITYLLHRGGFNMTQQEIWQAYLKSQKITQITRSHTDIHHFPTPEYTSSDIMNQLATQISFEPILTKPHHDESIAKRFFDPALKIPSTRSDKRLENYHEIVACLRNERSAPWKLISFYGDCVHANLGIIILPINTVPPPNLANKRDVKDWLNSQCFGIHFCSTDFQGIFHFGENLAYVVTRAILKDTRTQCISITEIKQCHKIRCFEATAQDPWKIIHFETPAE